MPQPTLRAEPAQRPRPPRIPRRLRPWFGLRPALGASVLLHLGLLALVVLAVLTRPQPAEPPAPPSFDVVYQDGEPDLSGETTADASNPRLAPPPDTVSPPGDVQPPPPPPMALPASLPLPPAPPPPPSPPRQQQLAAAAPPPPPPPPPVATDLPTPPPLPPLREPPRPEAALTAPPAPVPPRPAPSQRLAGVWMPDALSLAPTPPSTATRPGSPNRRLDLALGTLSPRGRDSLESEADVRGAKVGPDWRSAFRRWVDENKRYPENAVVSGHQGPSRVQVIADADGRVRSVRVTGPSGSVWLDAGTVALFRNARLPAFPPGSDPNGITIDFTMHYILVRH